MLYVRQMECYHTVLTEIEVHWKPAVYILSILSILSYCLKFSASGLRDSRVGLNKPYNCE